MQHHIYADNATDHAPGSHPRIDCDGTEIWWVAGVLFLLWSAAQLLGCWRLVSAPARPIPTRTSCTARVLSSLKDAVGLPQSDSPILLTVALGVRVTKVGVAVGIL